MSTILIIASIGLACLVLGLSLIIQSRALIIPSDRRPLLGRRIKSLTYWLLLPVAVVLLIFSLAARDLLNSYLPVSIMAFLLAVSLLDTGVLESGEKSQTMGGRIKWLPRRVTKQNLTESIRN